jgi:hypothetical protein
MWKVTFVVYFKVIFQKLFGLNEETHDEPWLYVFRSSGVTEISTSDLFCAKTVLNAVCQNKINRCVPQQY